MPFLAVVACRVSYIMLRAALTATILRIAPPVNQPVDNYVRKRPPIGVGVAIGNAVVSTANCC